MLKTFYPAFHLCNPKAIFVFHLVALLSKFKCSEMETKNIKVIIVLVKMDK